MKFLYLPFALCWLLHVLCVERITASRGGGADGVNGNEFLVGTANTQKLEINSHCERSTSASTLVEMSIYVYQKDTAFKYSNIGPDDDDFVDYETCFMIDAEEYIDNDNVNTATSLTNCGNSADMTKIDAVNPIDTGVETRTFTKQISFTPTDATYGCGGYQDSDGQAVFALTCKRTEGYDKAFDDVFIVCYDATADACVAKQLDTSYSAREPPTVNHRQELDVTFNAYRNFDIDNVPWPNGPQSTDGDHGGNINEITTDVLKLGEAIYFEICLINPSLPTDSSYRQFFEDGVGPIGIYVERCTATNDDVAGATGINPDTPVTIIENGCGKGEDPTEMIGKSATTNGRGFMYVKDTTDATKDWLRTPNCFRTSATPAVSFARDDADDTAITIYSCNIEYCTSSDDTRCFGDKTKDREDYPACARKKRETFNNTTSLDTYEYPKKVSLAVRVALPEFTKTQDETCQELTVLVSVSTILTVVLFVIVIVAGLMVYNVQSLAHADDDTSSSAIGIVNKGLFF